LIGVKDKKVLTSLPSAMNASELSHPGLEGYVLQYIQYTLPVSILYPCLETCKADACWHPTAGVEAGGIRLLPSIALAHWRRRSSTTSLRTASGFDALFPNSSRYSTTVSFRIFPFAAAISVSVLHSTYSTTVLLLDAASKRDHRSFRQHNRAKR